MKSVENVLRAIVQEPKFYGSLAGNNETDINSIRHELEEAGE